ncbi:DUF7115 domain-containing protein [Halomarina litorea]|uniref:DUF7115 domain-containing protein n=1 Tax=Halomarina litorea TaxID=2961595 RepID=UPI0020C36F3F|nr:hypothetical protein [Halomarina sp. BCD28]
MDSESPDLLAARLDGETVDALVPLDDDAVAVTPTRTLVYRAEGLLRDESVDEFPHETDRVECAVGRRKATVRLAYFDGTREFVVPKDRLDDVLEPLLGGVLAAADVADDGESVRRVYRFSELTLVVTDRRLVKHVGTALWDDDAESYPFDGVTGLDTEEGRVATELVLRVDGRPQRVKAPADSAREVRRTLETALLDHHGVGSLDDLAPEDAEEEPRVDARSAVVGEEGDAIGSLLEDEEGASAADERTSTDALADAIATSESGDAGAPPSGTGEGDADTATDVDPDPEDGGFRFGRTSDDPADPSAELARLSAAVERQAAALERQEATIDRLIEELRRGR